MIDKATISEWRKAQGTGMVSSVGEYTPAEFWELLDAYEAQEKHMRRWKTIKQDGLPEKDVWVVIRPKENFCGHEHPVLVHYDKQRNRFSEHGEEWPHGAVVKYREIELEEDNETQDA